MLITALQHIYLIIFSWTLDELITPDLMKKFHCGRKSKYLKRKLIKKIKLEKYILFIYLYKI